MMAGTCQRFFRSTPVLFRLLLRWFFYVQTSAHSAVYMHSSRDDTFVPLRGDRIPSADDGVVGRLDAIHIAVKQDTKTFLLLIHGSRLPWDDTVSLSLSKACSSSFVALSHANGSD